MGAVAFGELLATVVLTTETASSNGHGNVVAVDDATVDQVATSAEKVLVTAVSGEVTATDVLGAVSTFGLINVAVADDASFTKLKRLFKIVKTNLINVRNELSGSS